MPLFSLLTRWDLAFPYLFFLVWQSVPPWRLVERVAYKAPSFSQFFGCTDYRHRCVLSLQNLALLLFGANPKSFESFAKLPALKLAGGQLVISGETMVTILVGILVAVVLLLFIHKTRAGQAMLAVSEDKGQPL